MSDLFSKENLERFLAIAVDAQQAKQELLGLPAGTAHHHQESLCRRIERFEAAMNPTLAIELITRFKECRELSNRAFETVEKMANAAMALEKSVDDLRRQVGQYTGGN